MGWHIEMPHNMSIFSLVIKWLHRLKKRFGGGLMEEPPGIGEFALHFGSDSEFLKKITYCVFRSPVGYVCLYALKFP